MKILTIIITLAIIGLAMPLQAGGEITVYYCDSLQSNPDQIKVIHFDENGDPISPPEWIDDDTRINTIVTSPYYDGASVTPPTMARIMRWILFDAEDNELGRWRIWRFAQQSWPYEWEYLLENIGGGYCTLADDYLGGFYP